MSRFRPQGRTLNLSKDDVRELLAEPPKPCQRERSEIQLRRCPLNPRQWAPAGSAAAGRCLCCGVAFSEAAA